MSTVIFHNPACGTSRNVLAILKAAGAEPRVIEYLETGWTRPLLLALFAAAGLTPRDALRVSNSPAEAMGLTDGHVTEAELLDAMLDHPILVNRPLVCTPKGVTLCRPSDRVFALLDAPPNGPVLDADGQQIWPQVK